MIFVASYTPGLLDQDLYTLPLEAGLVYAVSNWSTRTSTPLWPFHNETTLGNRNPTRHPGRILAVAGGGLAVGTLTALTLLPPNAEGNSFALGPAVRGWIHSHLLTEIATSFAKNTFQRKRPFYDTVNKNGTVRQDDRRAFWSGHAAHAFTFANYSSLLVWNHVENKEGALLYASVSYGLATWIAGARAYDGQHHWSDVITGATVGLFTSSFVSSRVEQTLGGQASQTACDAGKCTSYSIKPRFTAEPRTPREYGLEFVARF